MGGTGWDEFHAVTRRVFECWTIKRAVTRMLTNLQIVALLDRCRREFGEAGYTLRDSIALNDVAELSKRVNKPYFTDFLSPFKSDLTRSNCLWTWVFDGRDPIGMIGARLDDFGDDNLLDFARRRIVGLSGEDVSGDYRIEYRLPEDAERVRGRVVYIGDLCVMPKRRVSIRCLTAAHLALILLEWRRFDWMYSFARDRDMRRGAVRDYLLSGVAQGANSWTVPPSAETGEHWLLLSSRRQLERLVVRLTKIPERL